ncbi:MAG TPA: C13 family peptidase [Burkholderiales bacterium]|jgi:hypothetical protein
MSASVLFSRLNVLPGLWQGTRALFLLRPDPRRIDADVPALCAMFVVDIAVSVLLSWIWVSFHGRFNWQALGSIFSQTPLLLLASWVAARRSLRGIGMLTFATLAMAISAQLAIALYAIAWLGAQSQWIVKWLYPVMMAWWLVSLACAYVRLVGRGLLGSGAGLAWIVAATATLLLPQPQLILPARDESGEPRYQPSIEREEAFHAQGELLQASLEKLRPQRPGVEDLYFVGFAGNASEDVFYKELKVIGPMMDQRFDTAGRSMLLVNNPRTVTTLPVATATNLRNTLRALGKRINPDEDVVMLYLTSHGSRHFDFDVSFWPLALNDLTPSTLKEMLDEAGIKWRVIVVSACYSGGYIAPLQDEQTLVMTAADATHTSFGCGSESDFTYFGRALFDEELRKTHLLPAAFERAKISIRAREQAQGYAPSNPQIALGSRMAEKLARMATRLDRGDLVASGQQAGQGAR